MIYFIQQDQDGPIKIGYSKNPENRLKRLQTASSHPLNLIFTMPGTRDDESSLHELFSDSRLEGEWFAPSEKLLAFLNSPVSVLSITDGEDATSLSGNKYNSKKFKLLWNAEKAQKALGEFHEKRRSFFGQLIFWLQHRKYFVWKQVADKKFYLESKGGFIFYPSSFCTFGVKIDSHNPQVWFPHPGFNFEYLYENDIRQFFPWIFQLNGAELLQHLRQTQCVCGGNFEDHSIKCAVYEDWGGYGEDGFIHLKNGHAELKIWLDWPVEQILSNPDLTTESIWT